MSEQSKKPEIDVRFEPAHELVGAMADDRPMLTWEFRPRLGHGWVLWYFDEPESETAGVDEYFVGGEFTDVDWAIAQAQDYLAFIWGPHER